MRVGLAYPAFEGAFRKHFPELEIIENVSDSIRYDLLILSGGEDINPNIYGQNNTHSLYNRDRDSREITIYNTYMDNRRNPKVLGVCRGHQLINALRGGRLIQDLWEEKIVHSGNHKLEFINESIFSDFKDVNSLHHQGVTNSGIGLRTTAIYNNIVEIVESDNIIGVQWHPEFMDYSKGKLFFEIIRKWVEGKIKINNSLPKRTLSSKKLRYKMPEEYSSNSTADWTFVDPNSIPQPARPQRVTDEERQRFLDNLHRIEEENRGG